MSSTNPSEIFPARSPKDRLALMSKPQPKAGYGHDYYDNPNFRGYGGYHYDGRYEAAAQKLIALYGLKRGDSVLEIGCAKGFLLYEFHKLGMRVLGLDASAYAVENCKPELAGMIQVHSDPYLPFAHAAFDLVIAKEVLPHLSVASAVKMIEEIQRVGKHAWLEIQCAETPASAVLMREWDHSHLTCKPANWWAMVLETYGYTGGFHCKPLF